jgi:hypothetical protein
MPESTAPIAYELQAPFAAEEDWVTLAVCATDAAAERGALCRSDQWGRVRVPAETRVVPILPRRAA